MYYIFIIMVYLEDIVVFRIVRECERILLFFMYGGSDCRLCVLMCLLLIVKIYIK